MTPWILAAIIAAGAVLFVLPPWLRQSAVRGNTTGRIDTLKLLHRSRREELQADAERGVLAQEDLAPALAELDATLLREVDALNAQAEDLAPPNAAASAARPLLTGLAMTVAVIAGTLWLYGLLGEPQAPELAQAADLLQLEESDTAALRDWQDVLSDRVARRPDDAKSRYLLGHVALKQRRYAAAAAAFEGAASAHGQADPNIELYLLQARFLAADGKLDADTRALAERLIAQRPGMAALYEVLAIDAFNRADFAAAVSVLNRALAQPLPAAQRASFQAGLAQARSRLGLPAQVEPGPSVAGTQEAPGATPAAAGPAIDVTIKGLASVPAERTLFVIARPPGGGMPYAVVRRPGPDFPAQVRLDDLVSMNPAAPLSSAPAVEVIVRASVTGTARRSPDDWQWSSETLSFADGQRQHSLVAELRPPG